MKIYLEVNKKIVPGKNLFYTAFKQLYFRFKLLRY